MPAIRQHGFPQYGLGARRRRFFNPRTGAGGPADKDITGDFIAVRLDRASAERLYQMSWAAQKIVDIKVDDMFAKGRQWTDPDQNKVDAMLEVEESLTAMLAIANTMKAGRLFGTALMIICTEDGDFEAPLLPEDVKEDSIKNLWVVDKWACSVETWVTDPTVPGLGSPYTYRVSGRIFGSPGPIDFKDQFTDRHFTQTQNFVVHRDRVFRFDGQRSPLTEGWVSGHWEREWGVSILTKAIDDIMRDATAHAAVGHLINESSIWVHKIQEFNDSIKGRQPDDEASAEEIAEAVSVLRSIYRTYFTDTTDEVSRVDVNFGGLADLMNQGAKRLAAVDGIPVTRFLGTSAVGLNATGEGDARDWRITAIRVAGERAQPRPETVRSVHGRQRRPQLRGPRRVSVGTAR